MPTPRSALAAARRRVEKFCDRDHPGPLASPRDDGRIRVTLDDERRVLSRAQAAALREALGDALAAECEFVHTSGEHRADGSYVVARRAADSGGHRKVFPSFGALRSVYADLPREFVAADVEAAGVSGSRRHLLVRHFAEHPAFDCVLVSRQPLTARKRPGAEGAGDAPSEARPADAPPEDSSADPPPEEASAD